jgi:hypothetical protein
MINPIYKFEIERPTTNLLDPSQMVKGVTLSSTTGKTSSASTMQVSGYMDVEAGVEYRLRNSENLTIAFLAVAFYGIDHAFISGASGGSTATAPTGAKYARISLPLSYDASEWQFAEESANFSTYVSSRVFPNFGNNVAKEYSKESGWEFFREKLNGEFTFTGPDYAYIAAQPFDHKFNFAVKISYDGGIVWDPYWRGVFWKTDCEINEDDKKVVVTPSSEDAYSALVDGMEKEFDLIPLAPEISRVNMDERPMIQVYVPGQDVIGCFLSGMWWEQSCEPVGEYDTFGENQRAITDKFFFAMVKAFTRIGVEGTPSPTIPANVEGEDAASADGSKYFDITSGGFRFRRQDAPLVDAVYITNTNGVESWVGYVDKNLVGTYDVSLTPVSGTGASGDLTIHVETKAVYARMICDVASVSGQPTSLIPSDDLVENNRNYKRVIAYYFPDTITFNTTLVTTPTQWGIRQPGLYYAAPYSIIGKEYFPIARSAWGAVSVWFSFSDIDWIVEQAARHQITLDTAYPLHSVIKVLLNQIDPTLTHEGTTAYSQFLYGENPLNGVDLSYFITPKSNIVVSEYDQPAQKAMITLKSVFDMLRDCFRCYWFIDGNKLRIEHITFFLNGGTYAAGEPEVGVDLTTEIVRRSGKAWAFNTARYTFDKSNMPTRYEFGWMDDVTKPFNGSPINILSGFVDKAKIESVKVADFTSDVDYMLLNPGACSKDGFALLSAVTPMLENTIAAVAGTRYENRIYADFQEGERVVISCTNVSVFRNGFVVIYDDTRTEVGRVYDTPTEIILPRATSYLFADRGQSNVIGSGDVKLTIQRGVGYELPYEQFGDSLLQNGPVSFCALQYYYLFDLPAERFEIDGQQGYAYGMKKLRVQEVTFPCLNDPDLQKLVKTSLGRGEIQKLSINLLSRSAKATLMYDTE